MNRFQTDSSVAAPWKVAGPAEGTFSRLERPGNRRARLQKVAALALLATAVGTSLLPAAIFTVGSDGACTHATITNALVASLAAGADEIRIARNQTYTNLYIHLTDWSPGTVGAVTLAGGYDTCADTTATGTTPIDGQATNPVVEVDTGSQPTSQVTLRGLHLTGSGEEGLRVGAGGQVTASETLLQGNGTGGAAVVDGGSFVIDALSTISENTGPGITCLTGSQVNTSASIHDNSATAGGGVVAGSTCDMNILHDSAIVANNATLGGGIYASSGATVLVDGAVASTFATEIADNTATDQGGGIYATGATTTVLIRNAAVTGNEAGLEGGGIWAGLGAKVTMDRVDGPCFSPTRCSDLSGNGITQVASFVPGAAVWVESGADVEIYQTIVESNHVSVDSSGGSVLFATGAGSTLTAEGLRLWNNQEADTLFEGLDAAQLVIAFVSASRNFYGGGSVASPVALGTAATATLNSSVFYPNAPFLVGVGALTEADCLILSNTTGLPGGATLISTSDPLFTNAIAGNLRPLPSSPAVDYCDTFNYFPQHFDGDHEARGFELSFNANGTPGVPGGLYDLGFDEVRPLFADGFGTGNTSAWSAVVP